MAADDPSGGTSQSAMIAATVARAGKRRKKNAESLFILSLEETMIRTKKTSPSAPKRYLLGEVGEVWCDTLPENGRIQKRVPGVWYGSLFSFWYGTTFISHTPIVVSQKFSYSLMDGLAHTNGLTPTMEIC